MTRVLGISGSLRRDSWNTKLLRVAAAALPPDAELVPWERLKEVPPFDEDDEAVEIPAVVADLKLAVARSDGVLWVTPEYNATIPGQLKNALDWLSRPVATTPLRGMPNAVIGASTGFFGALGAQQDLRKAIARAGGRVLDRELPLPHVHEHIDAAGRLSDPELEAELRALLGEFVDLSAKIVALRK